MNLTIAVCTYNRFDFLKKCLESIKNQTLSKEKYKLLVIDNSLSPKQSKEFKKSLKGYSNLEYIITDQCGIGYARTFALNACETEFIAFTDDDCQVPPDWATTILNAFARYGKGVGAIGGPIFPDWETQRPKWLKDKFLNILGILHWGDKETFIDLDSQWLLTANMAYRTKALRKAGGFPTHLGRRGDLPLAQEEFAANYYMHSLGYDLVYIPSLRVNHFVPDSKIEQKRLCSDGFWDGVSQLLFRSPSIHMDEVDNLANNLKPLEEQLLIDFSDYKYPEDLHHKINHMRRTGWEAAYSSLKEKASGDLLFKNKWPVFYIVTPCLNAVKTIDQTIASVLTQQGDFSIRYHIQDAGSTDGTLEMIESWKSKLTNESFQTFCKNIVFTYSSESDQNMYDGILKGFKTMHIPDSAFMTWINADDLLFPFALDTVLNIGRSFPEVCWIGGKVAVINENDKIWDMPERILPQEMIKSGLCDGLHWDFIQQEGTFFRGNIWSKAIAENVLNGFKLAGDWNLWRAFAHETIYYQLSWPLAAFRLHDGQISREKLTEYQDEINAMISLHERRQLFLELTKTQDLLAYNIEKDQNTGSLCIKQKNAMVSTHFYQHRLFDPLEKTYLKKLNSSSHIPPIELQKDQNIDDDLTEHSQTLHEIDYTSVDTDQSTNPNELQSSQTDIIYGPGWYDIEQSGNSYWRWTPKSGIIHIKSPYRGKSEIEFSFLSAQLENNIHLRLNGHLIKSFQANHKEISIEPFYIQLRKGINILEFSSSQEPIIPPTDPRELNFMIKNFKFTLPKKGKARHGLLKQLLDIENSSLFHSTYYKKQVGDLGNLSSVEHYLLYGAWEGMDPNPMFSSKFYLEKNRDVYASGMNPLLHYIHTGWKEGRNPHPEFNTNSYLTANPDIIRSRLNPLAHYLQYGILEGRKTFPTCKIDPDDFQDFTFSLQSHWKLFSENEFFGTSIDMENCTLKEYQELLVFLFINEHIASPSRILKVSNEGLPSRILEYFQNTHECWNINKLELQGIENDKKDIENLHYKLVNDSIGNFNKNLPDNYFDFVFSISSLQNTPEDEKIFINIIDDINRVLKPGGFSLHLFDVKFLPDGGFWTNKIAHVMFDKMETLNKFDDPQIVKDDPDLYVMSEKAYNTHWLHLTQVPYSEFGRPASLNILWKKPLTSA